MPASHKGDWQQAHGKIAKQSNKSCLTCHNSKFCLNCHKVQMPHPENFVMEHKKHGASLAQGSPCFKCHKQEYCAMCHPNQ
jgi:hypothetical protein